MIYWYFKNDKLQYTSNDMYMKPQADYIVVPSEEKVDTTKLYGLVDGKITIIGDAPPPPTIE